MTKEEFRDYVDFLRSEGAISYDVYSGLIDRIDTLEQEPCEDAVSREFLLNDLLLKAQGEKDVSIKWLEGYINSLPSVTPPKTRWIPVSEALPKEEEIVQITIDSSYYPRPDVDMGFYKAETKKWYWFDKEDIDPSIKVTAWMPLPKPYKAESVE